MMQAEQFTREYEYDSQKKQTKKKERQFRKERKEKKQRWSTSVDMQENLMFSWEN